VSGEAGWWPWPAPLECCPWSQPARIGLDSRPREPLVRHWARSPSPRIEDHNGSPASAFAGHRTLRLSANRIAVAEKVADQAVYILEIGNQLTESVALDAFRA
jgi:hypothetical protein